MIPSIDNVLGLEAVSDSDFPIAECILDALKICLECNNSVFNHFYLHVDSTAMGPHVLLL